MKNLFIILILFLGGKVVAQDGAGVFITFAHQEIIYDGQGNYSQALTGTVSDPLEQIDWEQPFNSVTRYYDSEDNEVYSSLGIWMGGDTLNFGWNLSPLTIGEAYQTITFFAQYENDGITPVWGVWYNDTIVIEDLMNITGLSEKEKIEFSIYPNPAVDFINITGLDVDEEICIFDQTGRLLVSPPAGTKKIEVSSFPYGVYLIRTKTGKTLKFLKG